MGVLLLLGVMVAFFAFTLGVHLGKRVSPHPLAAGDSHSAEPAATLPDQVPHRQEIQDQAKATAASVDEALGQALHDEVVRTGIKLDFPRQVNLPDKVKKVSTRPAEAPKSSLPQPETIEAFKRASPQGQFTLQIGSYTSIQDAKDQVDAVEALGLKPYLRSAEVRGRGQWYRIYLGGYETKEQAQAAGEKYRGQHVLESFVISKMVD